MCASLSSIGRVMRLRCMRVLFSICSCWARVRWYKQFRLGSARLCKQCTHDECVCVCLCVHDNLYSLQSVYVHEMKKNTNWIDNAIQENKRRLSIQINCCVWNRLTVAPIPSHKASFHCCFSIRDAYESFGATSVWNEFHLKIRDSMPLTRFGGAFLLFFLKIDLILFH